MILQAFAKINLTLDITGRREDGYHTLDSVMQAVSLYDEVEITPAGEPGVRLTTDRDYLPVNEKNTAYQAARLFLEHIGRKDQGVVLRLTKRIPSRAGLGGGSADAAAVLRGMNQLFQAGLTTSELLALGAKIGADVPFCLLGGTCRCTGIGEITEPAPPLPDCFIVLCKPPAGMSTPRAYALLDQRPPARTKATPKLLEALETKELWRIGKALGNRFDDVLRLMQVRRIEKIMISAGAAGAQMTGSGSAVFGLFETEEAARCCMMLLEEKGEVFLTKPVQFFS